jgi:hypothetical protein
MHLSQASRISPPRRRQRRDRSIPAEPPKLSPRFARRLKRRSSIDWPQSRRLISAHKAAMSVGLRCPAQIDRSGRLLVFMPYPPATICRPPEPIRTDGPRFQTVCCTGCGWRARTAVRDGASWPISAVPGQEMDSISKTGLERSQHRPGQRRSHHRSCAPGGCPGTGSLGPSGAEISSPAARCPRGSGWSTMLLSGGCGLVDGRHQ